MEEQISKKKAADLFEFGRLDQLEAGSFVALQEIYRTLFDEIYDFAGEVRLTKLWRNMLR